MLCRSSSRIPPPKRGRGRARTPENLGDEWLRTWPTLRHLGLSGQQQADRLHGIGGSDANVLLSGNTNRISELWRVKRGQVEAEDLSGVIPVMLGCWTEPFNRQWYERLSGKVVSEAGHSFICPLYGWRRCTVDGLIDPDGAIFEAKHTSAFAKSEDMLERYMPQLQHNMAVTRRDRAVLSVIFGNHKYEIIEVGSDWLYQQELLEAEAAFWDCVQTGREPVAPPAPPAPRPIGTREVCLEGNNAWASAACAWLQHRRAAKVHASATGLIKSLVEEDVSRAFGHGIEAKRSRSGALTIREIA